MARSSLWKPGDYTLLFKNHKATIVLNVDKHESLDSIKAKLLKALEETSPNGFNGHAIPTKPDNIALARPDLENAGEWVSISESSKQLTETPHGLGLKDGGVVAFKFDDDDGDFEVVQATMEETYGDAQ